MLRRILLLSTIAILAYAQDAVIQIDAAKPAGYTVPRTIYGTFLEPIGNSIYGGLWAQILENPSLEDNLWSATALKGKLDANPALYRASQLGLPIPWEPLDQSQGARYEPRWNDAANSHRSLLLMALPEQQTGIRQQVYLPVHRTLRYVGSIYAKHVSGPAAFEVSLRKRNRPEMVFAHAAIEAPDTGWKRYEFILELSGGQVARLEPADFVISATGGARVLIDQVFLWPSDHVDGMDPDMIALSKALRSPILRYGGNFTSAYHWRDGIGPMDRRVSMLNLAWGMPEYNHFGTDELLQFCKLIGAEPQIAVNLGTGTPGEAAEWVDYVNKKWNGGRGGLWWELGNELWGDFQTGYPTISRIAGLTESFSRAIRAVDPASRLIATGADPDHFDKWNAEQLKIAPSAFDALSTHFVVRTGDIRRKQPDADFTALSAFALPVELERRLRAMKDQVDATPARGKVRLAFTEWLFWGRDDREPRFTNMGGAICTAGMLNTLIRTADFTPVSDMTGLIEFGGIWKKRGQVYGVPAYWAFRMYSTSSATRPVAVMARGETYDISEGSNRLPEIPKVPYLDVVAALDDGGTTLTVFVVNRHLTRDLTAEIHLDHFQPAARARQTELRGASIYEANDETDPESVMPVESAFAVSGPVLKKAFPPSSVSRIEFRRER
jgi:alpha-L-arabinofuranosidase